ncbi:MAG: hypothetical protein COW59_01110 [Lysobacterales bacterium CG17_big_fil_post_rev_8_21_14_2_50_64_11]|nr:MAG: hypothetical protein COW59_01110 [Xanthomonadales bacterium CG17_big_fil_post_rev_8_21_14_2_50_64_11]
MSESRLAQWQGRFNALSERERLLVFGAALVVCWGLVELLFLGDVRTQRAMQAQNVATLRAQVDQLSARQSELDQQITAGPLQAAQAQEADVRKRIGAADLALRGEGVRYLDANRAREVLHELLKGSGLTLVAMRNLPAEIALSTRDSDAAAPAAASQEAAAVPDATAEDGNPVAADGDSNGVAAPSVALDLFRHPITVELEGSYADMVRYLARIEGSEWGLMWHELKIDTLDYPRARLRFVVYSFSLEEAWIGV